MAKKERLDVILTEQGLFKSRSQAKRSIMAGLVYVDDQQVDKAGTKIDPEANIRVKGDLHPYVSRGGLKLEKAIDSFEIDLQNKLVIDIGASTGGFTDCSLQNGARKVYAIDVGYNQLAWKLRSDDRVVCMEKTNARYLSLDDIGEAGDIGTIDVAFISLTKILPALINLLKSDGEIIALIKPQFEAGPDKVGNNGVVKDKTVHKEVINKIMNFALEIGLTPLEIDYSPITGGKGHNIEYLSYFTLDQSKKGIVHLDEKIINVIDSAHQSL
ncbi:TlyA family RNA methyltransferase [Orenia marismortui]|uniref:23S rRNA (Cytidine1920-2'-O)/16S rRNA (Cytidine1409-2'-O)-methyltransferase n=1 Tax=Orenia marismortui TaxID=46469 RepID=A0A4R8GR47_9FIRM|nr:TlyA family RNA methyltransferase [Orenia marismortui]TDX48263.1 23S rRNA (cytidine1920-2'-O)/16S rRNA (cytidine1409-2'-O)-methyltransferase [Orenia marismortui]